MPVFIPQKSKIKMVILTRHKEKNTVWWSPLNQNKRRSEKIIESMLKRFKKTSLYQVTNVVQFYENGVLIHTQRI